MFVSPACRRALPAMIFVAALTGCAGSNPSGEYNPAVQSGARSPSGNRPPIIAVRLTGST